MKNHSLIHCPEKNIRPCPLPDASLPCQESPQPGGHSKRIAVVGRSSAGIRFALIAARRGHTVEILDSGTPAKDVSSLETSPDNSLRSLWQEAEDTPGITVVYGTATDAAQLKVRNYDVLIFTARQEGPLPLPGMEHIRHLQAAELLTSRELPEDVRQIVVVGGGATGCEAACRLAGEPGRKVHVVEMLPNFMEGVRADKRNQLIRQLEQAGVDLVNCARVTGFADGVVYIERNVSAGIPDPYNTHQPMLPKNIPTPLAGESSDGIYIDQLTADLVVLATGNPGRQLFQEALSLKAAAEIYDIASETGTEAEEAAYRLACRI